MARKDILATPKAKAIKLSDGKTYKLPAFNLNVLANLEEEFDCDIENLGEKLTEHTASAFRKLLWVLLRENYPDMSITDAGKLVSLDEMATVVKELTTALEGLKV